MSIFNRNKGFKDIDHGDGFYVDAISPRELKVLREAHALEVSGLRPVGDVHLQSRFTDEGIRSSFNIPRDMPLRVVEHIGLIRSTSDGKYELTDTALNRAELNRDSGRSR